MSTLTKIMIVLLTLASIFLCGTVTTYVAHAQKYKSLYEQALKNTQIAKTRQNSKETELREKKTEFQHRQDQLNQQISTLEKQVRGLNTELGNLKTENAGLQAKVEKWGTITQNLSETNANQQAELEKTTDELSKLKAKQIVQEKKAKETVNKLVEKNAIIGTLQADKKRLEEQKTQLQNKLDRLLSLRGKETAVLPTVTPQKVPARPVQTFTREIGLRGKINAVDLRNSVAEISIGSAQGVKEGMKFYVTRGQAFICEILIIDVEPDKAVGVLERVRPQNQPKPGDRLSTNL